MRIDPVPCPQCGALALVRADDTIVSHWTDEGRCRANELTMADALALPRKLSRERAAEIAAEVRQCFEDAKRETAEQAKLWDAAAKQRHVPTNAEWANGHTESVASQVARESRLWRVVDFGMLAVLRVVAWAGRKVGR